MGISIQVTSIAPAGIEENRAKIECGKDWKNRPLHDENQCCGNGCYFTATVLEVNTNMMWS
jgi:hypothetical protein